MGLTLSEAKNTRDRHTTGQESAGWLGGGLFLQARRRAAEYRNRAYVLREKWLLALSHRRGLRILISEKPEWADQIAAGFEGTPHQVTFGPIAPDAAGQFDLLVPLEIDDLVRVGNAPDLARRNPIPIPSAESLLLCDDKFLFSQALIEKGFGDNIPRIGQDLRPPYILKKRVGYAGRQCWMIRNHEEESRFADLLNNPEFYRQEIVPGTREFATHLLFANNRVVKSLTLMYEFDNEMPIKGKDRLLVLSIRRCPYLLLFSRILTLIGFEGLCCVNYKVAGGRPYILEINPRFGGSLSPFFFSFIRHLPRIASAPSR